jgi:hypothetical protein
MSEPTDDPFCQAFPRRRRRSASMLDAPRGELREHMQGEEDGGYRIVQSHAQPWQSRAMRWFDAAFKWV